MEINVITQIDLFEFINTFFTNKVKYAQITDKAKSGHAFMLNRFLSIYYPKEIQIVNSLHSVAVMDALHHGLCTGKVPRWIYTKSTKSTDDPFGKIIKSTKLAFCKLQNIEYKSLQLMYDMWPEYTLTELHALHDTLTAAENAKQKRTRKSS